MSALSLGRNEYKVEQPTRSTITDAGNLAQGGAP
jgi:hypothetical protein